MDVHVAHKRANLACRRWLHGRREPKRTNVFCSLLVATIMFGSLVACAPGTRPTSALANAEIEAVRFSPGAGSTIVSNTSVSASFDYRIASFDAPLAGRRDPGFFAVLEARSADDRVLLIDACGRDAQRTLESDFGSVSLTCAMRMSEPTTDEQELILQVRIYQRIDKRRSVTIGSSGPVSLRHARTTFTPLDQVFLPPCPDVADRDIRERAAVIVCRG